METKTTLIHWFRKGLRVHDNPALNKTFTQAINSPDKYFVRPIFILDPGILDFLHVGANRWRFLQQTLEDLQKQLLQLNSRLYVIRGKPAVVFSRIFREWNAIQLSYETDIEPYAIKRDLEISALAKEAGVEVLTYCSHTIFNPEIVLSKNFGKAPLTYQKFLEIIGKLKIPQPLGIPEKLNEATKPKLDNVEKENADCYNYPSMNEIVKKPSELGDCKFPGGETEALRRLDASLYDEDWVVTFEKPKTSPNSLEPSTTVLSPYLKFGCLSARLFHQRLSACLSRHPKHTKPPVSLMGQLMWREFYYTAAASESNFDRMFGNTFCLQIPWQLNEANLEAWTYGRTGYPFIDAIMRQLRQEGWIHHLARHAVACFLTRGDLWISWEEGQKVFEELLLDQDWALNAGNWMWLSASAFFHQYFRVYSPVAFGKKTDPTGMYIRKYVPELSKYPANLIFEPWKATRTAQQEYGCIIGTNYPERIVIHETVHKENIQKMNAAYKVNREVRTGKLEDSIFTDDTDKLEKQSKKRKTPTATNKNKRFKF